MSRPIIKKILPFDADKEQDIFLAWTGSRAHANRIIIRSNETNEVTFDDTISTYELRHTIPAGTLTNGKSWTMEALVYDGENIASASSEKVLFYTFKTPDFDFKDIPQNHQINSASFTASISYHSQDWENISSYVFYLYDSTGKQLVKSNTMHDIFNIAFTYRGLENNTAYAIRCTAVTVHGMILDTGLKDIQVKYENPNTYARIYTTALPEQGCVQVASNLIVIQYNGTDHFSYENSMIDLIGKTLCYDEGFLIEDDFTVIIRGKNLWQTADILKMKNDGPGLTLSSRIYTDETLRFRLLVPNGVCSYLLYSDEQIFTANDMVTIVLRRKSNLYQLKVFVEKER